MLFYETDSWEQQQQQKKNSNKKIPIPEGGESDFQSCITLLHSNVE